MVVVLAALALAAPIAFWIFGRDDEVPSSGPSMRPTMSGPEPIHIDYDAYEDHGPRLGDVVAFQGPDETLGACADGPPRTASPCATPMDRYGDKFLVKRIVGLPGDRLAIAPDGRVIRNGKLSPQRSIIRCRRYDDCALPRAIVVPPGTYFAMGDNRRNSFDSRDFGPVPREAFDGRVILPK